MKTIKVLVGISVFLLFSRTALSSEENFSRKSLDILPGKMANFLEAC